MTTCMHIHGRRILVKFGCVSRSVARPTLSLDNDFHTAARQPMASKYIQLRQVIKLSREGRCRGLPYVSGRVGMKYAMSWLITKKGEGFNGSSSLI